MTPWCAADFLAAVSAGPDAMTPWLDDDVVYRAADLPALRGRLAVQQVWRRLFRSYGTIRVAPRIVVQDEDVVMARQLQTFGRAAGGTLELTSTAVYVIRDGRIADWRDWFDRSDLPPEEAALWERLWRARW